jgi:type IV pilus assembly protein PilW
MMRRLQRGTTLIELMVALAIGLILSIAIFSVMSIFEGRRRTLDAGADLDQTGNIALFQVDRWVRSAGTGLVQANSYAYGCKLFASNASGTILPAPSFPAPFASVNKTVRMAPVMILSGATAPGASVAGLSTATSDVLMVMSSGTQNAQVPTLFTAAAGTATLNLPNTLAFSASDIVLLADTQPGTGNTIANCLVTQADPAVTSGANTTMALSGTYYAASISTANVTDFSATGAAIGLGNLSSTTGQLPPSFQMIGVGDNNRLLAYDLLRTTAAPLQELAEGVFEMHALYGVDSVGDGLVHSWVKADSGTYALSALTAGTPGAAALLKTIRAVRVGLILRTALPEKNAVNTSTSIKLFADLPTAVQFTRTLGSTEQVYRYRTLEETIPVRNNQF